MQQERRDEAGTKLSRPAEEAVQGETAGAACGGMAQACRPAAKPAERIGFMPWIQAPEDIDAMGREEIIALFEGRCA